MRQATCLKDKVLNFNNTMIRTREPHRRGRNYEQFR